MKKYSALMLISVLLTTIFGCTITHQFGPFMGKIVDSETGKPIEGAAVLIAFFTKSGTFGGTVYSVADAIETLSDEKGEFYFNKHRINLFKGMSSWDDRGHISIFKPGYGAYPGHSKAFSSQKDIHSYYITQREYVTFHLPKLATLDERKENHFKIETIGGIDNEKMPNLRRLIIEDSEYLNRNQLEK